MIKAVSPSGETAFLVLGALGMVMGFLMCAISHRCSWQIRTGGLRCVEMHG